MDIPSPVPVPYFRESTELPDSLPSTEEILSLVDSIDQRETATNCVIVRDTYFVKFGLRVTENEGNTLLFLEKNLPEIPAPRLHAMYNMQPGRLVLIMDYIPGDDLSSVWESLSQQEKLSLTTEIGKYLREMRILAPPPDFVGSIAGGPVPFRFFWTLEPKPIINGPFKSAADLGLALAEKSKDDWEFNNKIGWKTNWFRRNLPSAMSGNIKLTHSDFHPGNIIVQLAITADSSGGVDLDTSSEKERYCVRAIVDWETAGWYPEYWEYGINVALSPWNMDWIEALEKMTGPFPLQAAMLHMVREDLDG